MYTQESVHPSTSLVAFLRCVGSFRLLVVRIMVVVSLSGLSPSQGRIVGFDVTEVSPPYDHAEVTSTLAARVSLDLLGYIQANK